MKDFASQRDLTFLHAGVTRGRRKIEQKTFVFGLYLFIGGTRAFRSSEAPLIILIFFSGLFLRTRKLAKLAKFTSTSVLAKIFTDVAAKIKYPGVSD